MAFTTGTDDVKVNSGIYVGEKVGGGRFSAKNVIEDFMKTEYEEGFRNEFNTMDALINKLPKDTITGKVKYKAFKLGISDNVRAVGSGAFDRYELGMDDFWGQGSETVEAQFDTTKLMATFSITDEAILKGTGDGSLVDVLKDSLSNMEIGMKHTYNRYIYGSYTGKIGAVVDQDTANHSNASIIPFNLSSAGAVEASARSADDWTREYHGVFHNKFRYGKAPDVVKFKMKNSHSLIEGMGIMVENIVYSGASTISSSSNVHTRLIGRIWQKDNSAIHDEVVYMIVEKVLKGSYANSAFTWADGTFSDQVSTGIVLGANDKCTVYSRQLDDKGAVAREYTGLEDIVVTQNNYIFGIDRNVYKTLNSVAWDAQGSKYVNEEILRDLSDHLALTSPEGTQITLCCAEHRIISQVEKSLYQFKNYNLQDVGKGMNLGGGYELRFDNYVLYKDKYARDNNLYMLDQAKIGELVRRDFTWITSGEVNGVLQRRPGTEMYEGIMNKYADMYVDAFKCHAVIKNCAVVAPGNFFSYQADGTPKSV